MPPPFSKPAESDQAPHYGASHDASPLPSAQSAPVESLPPTVAAAPSIDVFPSPPSNPPNSFRAPPPPSLASISLTKNADTSGSALPAEGDRPMPVSVPAPPVSYAASDPNKQGENEEAKTLVSRANASQREGNFEGAIVLYTQALEKARSTDQSAVLFNRSVALARMFRWEEALQDANECVKFNPNWSRGPQCQGTALEGLGRLPEALAAFETALALEPGNQVSSCLRVHVFGREAYSWCVLT